MKRAQRSADGRSIDRAIDELFSREPSEFIAARDALVKELREAGDKEGAAEVKALRRPTVAAWAINQLAQSDPDGIEELVEAGEALRTASLGRTGAKELREAVARRREVVKRLTEATKRILPPSSATETNLSAIAQTLEAASVDEQAAEELRRGRLSKELALPAAFPGFGAEEAAAPPLEREKPAPTGKARGRPGPTAAEVRRLERDAAKAEQRAADAAQEENRARRDVERLEAQLTRARQVLKDRSAERKEADRVANRARAATGPA
jgi:hypothetical protein